MDTDVCFKTAVDFSYKLTYSYFHRETFSRHLTDTVVKIPLV